eukprot:TRINITY_DN30653_c0_g1_i1.p1 TRINITY_DN30653_c0_g1~~TRINITY_DN30653_c0_g1_i1.p1  ORF type:complete len:244 (+),score=50.77 TRINITY_DN30653_c0_g1_i1:67-732(+)
MAAAEAALDGREEGGGVGPPSASALWTREEDLRWDALSLRLRQGELLSQQDEAEYVALRRRYAAFTQLSLDVMQANAAMRRGSGGLTWASATVSRGWATMRRIAGLSDAGGRRSAPEPLPAVFDGPAGPAAGAEAGRAPAPRLGPTGAAAAAAAASGTTTRTRSPQGAALGTQSPPPPAREGKAELARTRENPSPRAVAAVLAAVCTSLLSLHLARGWAGG